MINFSLIFFVALQVLQQAVSGQARQRQLGLRVVHPPPAPTPAPAPAGTGRRGPEEEDQAHDEHYSRWRRRWRRDLLQRRYQEPGGGGGAQEEQQGCGPVEEAGQGGQDGQRPEIQTPRRRTLLLK